MQELINAKIKELTENGKLDEIVTKETAKFIQNIISDILSPYSEVGKVYKEKLRTSLIGGVEKLDFVQYSNTLTDLIESELNQTVVSIGIQPVKEMIKEFTGSLEKKNWKLSEIVKVFIEDEVGDDSEDDSGEITFIYEKSDYGTIYIGIDKDKKRNRYNCKYRLMIDSKTNKMYSPTIEGMPIHPVKEVGGLHGFDLFLFKLYAMGCSIECDEHNVETEWSTYN